MQTDKFPAEVSKLMILSRELEEVMVTEIDFVRAKNFEALSKMQTRKQELTSLYATQMEVFKTQPHLIQNLNSSQKDELMAVTKTLHEASEMNEMMLRASYDASQRIMLVLLEVVQKQQEQVKSYTQGGMMGSARTAVYARNTLPLTLDQRL